MPAPGPLHLLFILPGAIVPRYPPSIFPQIIQVSAKYPLTQEAFPDISIQTQLYILKIPQISLLLLYFLFNIFPSNVYVSIVCLHG